MTAAADRESKTILYAVTSAGTALELLRGQLGYLRSHGYGVSLVVSPDDRLAALAVEEDIDVLPLPMAREIAPRQDLRALLGILRVVARQRPAVLNYGTPKAALLAGLAGWVLGVPHRVYVVRGLRLEGVSGGRRALLWLVEWLTLRTATEVWFVSPSLQRRSHALRLTRAGDGVVLGSGSSNGVDVQHFRPGLPGFGSSQSGRQPSGPVIGFVGRLTRDKGVPELWHAFNLVRAALPGAALLLVGDFEDGDPVPPRIATQMRGDPDVTITGWTAVTLDYYRSMDVLALPTHREGLPNVVLEGSACGLPVVTTRATGAVDSVVDGVTGLVVPVADVDALAAALLTVLRDKELARGMGRAGRERVVRHFDAARVWEAIEQRYRTMLATSHTAPAPSPDRYTQGGVPGDGTPGR